MPTKIHESEENCSNGTGFAYPLYRGEVPSTAKEWLEKKRRRDNTEGLWRVHDGLYDLTEFIMSHPGGSQWIDSSKGTDITEAFETHHLKGIAETNLKNYFVKKTKTPRNQPFTFKEDGFYKTLKTKITSKLSEIPTNTRKESDRITDSLLITFILLTPAGCWAWNFSILLGLGMLFLNSLIFSFLITSAHSYFHRADNWRMYLFNLNGQSFEQWRITHALSHHIFTNTTQDAEISLVEPLLQLLPYKDKPLWARLAFFYWPVVGIILFVRPVWKRFRYSSTDDNNFEWPQLIQFFLPVWMLVFGGQSVFPTLFLWVGISFLGSFYFVLFGITAGHHTTETAYEGDIASDTSIDWGVYQLNVVIERAEYAGKGFLSLTLFGDHGLHHLFPTLDQAELKYLYPILLDHCKEFGIELRTTSFAYALMNMFIQIGRRGPKKIDQ